MFNRQVVVLVHAFQSSDRNKDVVQSVLLSMLKLDLYWAGHKCKLSSLRHARSLKFSLSLVKGYIFSFFHLPYLQTKTTYLVFGQVRHHSFFNS